MSVILTATQKEVIRKIIYAVETGGQVYGNVRYDDFTEAYANSSIEYAITIGGGAWYATEAQRLLKLIRTKNPTVFKKLDTAGIGIDLDTKNWATYKVQKGSDKAKCIQKIIGSATGIKCQDLLIDEQMQAYVDEVSTLGITDIQALLMCANFRHQGGLSAVKRILAKTQKPYTLNNVYKACQSDTGNQVGAYKLRQKMVYESLKKYITDKGNNTNMITKAINAVINIALAEVGYLEKATNANLDDKTANAGSNNYTKYWRDIYPAYQGQPWCACFVTWVFVIAFGKAMAQKLLKHYPYVYCPTMADLFTLNANPKVGDIVIFKHNGVFTHTGIVIKVSGDQFWTVEGNTSGGSTIIANGGAVCKKTYFNSNLPGTKFITPDYSKVQEIKNEGNDTPSISASSILKMGSNGSAVKTLQKNLNTLIKAKLTVDGEFGTATYNAVIKFQTKYKLTADGIVGENTQKKINSLLKKKNSSTATTHSTKSVVGEVTANELNVRSWYGIDSSTGKKYPTIVSYPKLKKTNRVSILATYKVNGETWYKIAINNAATKNKDVIGFVCGKCADGTYVKIV
jgi:hypothetical protein